MNIKITPILYLLLVACWLGLSISARAQSDVIAGVQAALKSGSSKEISRHMNTNLQLIIEPENVDMDNVGNTQAEIMLRGFMQKYPAKDFFWGENHKGNSPAGIQFRKGTYIASNGTPFGVFIVVKQFDGRYLIDKLYIQK